VNSKINAINEEKRRIENRVTTLEEDLEEEQMNNEAALEKAKKAQQMVDSLTQENSSLQSSYNQSESNRVTLDKQVQHHIAPGVHRNTHSLYTPDYTRDFATLAKFRKLQIH
jgi:Skp family chaperone for outer membrane proteins